MNIIYVFIYWLTVANKVIAFQHIHGANLENLANFNTSVFAFVPSFKPAAALAERVFSLHKGHFRYGMKGQSTKEIRDELVTHDLHLANQRKTFAWIASASPEYQSALSQVHYLSNVHSRTLDIQHRTRELVPKDQVDFWAHNLVLNQTEQGLIQELGALNQLIQGLSTLNGISIVGVFSEQVHPSNEPRPFCTQVHDYRDYLIGTQVQGYALAAAALNYNGQHATAHKLLDLGLARLKQQEKVLGGRFDDWYFHGKASCSYQIQMLKHQQICLKVHKEVNLLNDYTMICTGKCNLVNPEDDEQWIYNSVSWQIVPRKNQSQCLQKLFDGYNNGILIVLKDCHRHTSQNYNEKWVVDSSTGQIKLFADPNKCLAARKDGSIVLNKCSANECIDCPDRWGNVHLSLHQKVESALRSPYGDLHLVTWMGLEI